MFSKKNQIELTFTYETDNTVNNKYMFIEEYLSKKADNILTSPVNYTSQEIYDIIQQVGMVKDYYISHDPTIECLTNLNVRKIELRPIAKNKIILMYTFIPSKNEDESINNIINCNRSVLLKSFEEYITPSNIKQRTQNIEETLKIFPKIFSITNKASKMLPDFIQLKKEMEMLTYYSNYSILLKNTKEDEAKYINELLENIKLKIVLRLKDIDKLLDIENVYEGDWIVSNKIKRMQYVLKLLKENNLNIKEVGYEVNRSIGNSNSSINSLYIFTFLLGALIILLIEKGIKTFNRNVNRI